MIRTREGKGQEGSRRTRGKEKNKRDEGLGRRGQGIGEQGG